MVIDRLRVRERLASHWPAATPSNRVRFTSFVMETYDRYLDERLEDRHFTRQLLSDNPYTFQQRLSELLMAEWLWRHEFTLTPAPKGRGPDFKVEKEGKSAWIELVSPEPRGLPADDITLPKAGEFREARSVPHTQRALCWTSALSAKQSQLQKHRADGVISPNDVCVIAVNARMLDSYYFDIAGISQLPVPVELSFGVGPLAIEIDPTGIDAAGPHVTYRSDIANRNGSPVGTHLFLDPAYDSISGILGVSLHDGAAFDKSYPSAVAYNPRARCQLPPLWLPSEEHWVARECKDRWLVTRMG